MTSNELRQKFRDFFEKKYNHKWVESSSLIPDDPSVLLTTAGMQQFKKYFTGELKFDPKYKGAVSIQKCFRTVDIDEVGDESHDTFFEMLGNFSFGGYFKREAIEYAHEFITKELGLKIDYVSVFEGDGEVPADSESENIWKSLGITDVRKMGRADNFWGPTGSEGPCGPTTEIYVNGVEIWNLVFNEYYSKAGKLTPLATKGVDTGMGLERLATVVQGKRNIFQTDLFVKPYEQFLAQEGGRMLADHMRASMFLIADGLTPSNKGAGYILRRLIRRATAKWKSLGFNTFELITDEVENAIRYYGGYYKELIVNKEKIVQEIKGEIEKFNKTLQKGLSEFLKRFPKFEAQISTPGEDYKVNERQTISGKDVFYFHQTYGLTIDVLKDLAKPDGHEIDENGFEEEFKAHQEKSRAGAEKKFGGHGLLLDTGELKAVDERELKIVTRLHTATHLMQAALREVLGPEVKQNGSDITAERTRFDFFFPRKLTDEEKKKVEDLVNQKIQEDLPVSFTEMPIEEAKKTGALYFFKAKYGDRVKVYFMGKDLESAFSREFCGGPHVSHTGEVGRFKILKEESAAAGIRRLRATIT